MKSLPFRSLVIQRSYRKLLCFMILLMLFGAMSISNLQDGDRGPGSNWRGWLGLMFSGVGCPVLVLAMLVAHRVPLAFSPNGFVYQNVFKSEVCWKDVSRLSVVSYKQSEQLYLEFTENAYQALDLTMFGRYRTKVDRMCGKRRICVQSLDLKISFTELERYFRLYLAEHNPDALTPSV